MSVARLLAYLIWMALFIMVLVGGWGMLLPTVFNWDHDLMFVILPITMILLIAFGYLVGRKLCRMVRKDLGI